MTFIDPGPPTVETHEPEDVDDFEGVDDEPWLATTNPRGVRVRLPMAALILGLALVLGVWGGAKLEANQSSATTPAATTGAGPGFPAGGRQTGATGGAAGGGGGLSGTVASVQGSQIKLTTGTGSTVTVNLLPSTTVTRTAAAAPTDITNGETVTVRGQTGSDGATTAQSVAIVPAAGG